MTKFDDRLYSRRGALLRSDDGDIALDNGFMQRLRTSLARRLIEDFLSLKDAAVPARDTLTCPSALSGASIQLFGVISREGKVDFLREPLDIDNTARAALAEGCDPLLRFRFARPCMSNACTHWNGDTCLLGLAAVDADIERAPAPAHCAIRPTCRWHAQSGITACRACTHMISSLQ